MTATTAVPAPTTGAPTPPVRERKQDARHKRGAGRWFVLALAAVVALLMLAPFVIMVLNAFKSPAQYSQDGPLSIPTELTGTASEVRDDVGGAGTDLIFPPIVSFLALGFALVLSIWKPWGRTRWGERAASDRDEQPELAATQAAER